MAKAKRKNDDSIEAAFAAVPDIGKKWTRWYDVSYKILRWVIRRKKIVPQPVRRAALSATNVLLQFNVLERYKVWDRGARNVGIPDKEHVTVPAIVVVELFTPNEAANLRRAIKKNKWDKHDVSHRETNSERLSVARSQNSMSWWRLKNVVNGDINSFMSDSVREELPQGIQYVSLRAVQIGSGLTAVVARFSLTDEYARHVDDVLHKAHEPFMKWHGRIPHPVDREFASYEATQKARNSLHKAARTWMKRRCPGYFAVHDEQQLSMDVMLTEEYDPISKKIERPDPSARDTLRALGINYADYYRTVSPNMPDMVLMQADSLAETNLNISRTWGWIGNYDKIKKATDNFKYYGDANNAMGHLAEDQVSPTLILLAISELLNILDAQYANLRDSARQQHKQFRLRSVNKLSSIILDTSVTLASIRQDVKSLVRHKRWFDEAKFMMTPSPLFSNSLKAEEKKPIDFFDDVIKRQGEVFDRLAAVDADYRNILATVSSLGSSSNSISLGRWALSISLVSLLVASVTLYAASPELRNATHNVLKAVRP